MKRIVLLFVCFLLVIGDGSVITRQYTEIMNKENNDHRTVP